MKIFISTFLILFFQISIGQNKSFNELSDSINNSQIVVTTGRIWGAEMRSKTGDEIVKLGKKVTPQLISLLTDNEKGIIAHFILTEIWRKKIGEVISSEVIEGKKLYIVYNQLNLFLKNEESFYSREEDLNENKLRWESFVQNKGSW
ncbi:hypothetical protein [Flavobacterium sp.]|uniref:hypothetical protein n=1 Tax=Flavobacterium sp. TaxID=239 RepID=UPI00352805B2